ARPRRWPAPAPGKGALRRAGAIPLLDKPRAEAILYISIICDGASPRRAPSPRPRRRTHPARETPMARTTPQTRLAATALVWLYPNHGGQRSGIRNAIPRTGLRNPVTRQCPLTFSETVAVRRNRLFHNAFPLATPPDRGGRDSVIHSPPSCIELRKAAPRPRPPRIAEDSAPVFAAPCPETTCGGQPCPGREKKAGETGHARRPSCPPAVEGIRRRQTATRPAIIP